MSTIGMRQPRCRARDRFVAAVFALAVPSIALAAGDSISLPVPNEAAPPTGSVQLEVQALIGDPTPIIVDLLGADPGSVLGVTLPGAPNTAGTVVTSGNALVIRTVSPSAPLVSGQAPVGTTASLTLRSVLNGTVSITDVLPGGGLLPAGSLVAVVGMGFQAAAVVLIDGIAFASASWVNSSRIEVVTAAEMQLDGRNVTVINPDGTGANYVAYLRATDLGKSARPLLAATEAIFPIQTLSSAVFAAPTSGTFFGLALQNPQPADSIVSIELWDAGAVVASASLALSPRTKISREVSEFLPGVIPGAGSSFRLTATVPVQMLGLSGDETDGSVTPVLPALASP